MSEIEALQARVAAAQAQLGQAHENRHEQSARLAELIGSVEKTLAAKQSEIEGYTNRIQGLEQKNEQLRGLLEGLLAVIEGTGTDRLSEALQNLDGTFAALAGGAAAAPAEPVTAEAGGPMASVAEAILGDEAQAVNEEDVAEDTAAAEDPVQDPAAAEAPPEDLAALLDVDDSPAEGEDAGEGAPSGAEDELSADAVAELLGEPAEDAALEGPVQEATPMPADHSEAVMGELHIEKPAEAASESLDESGDADAAAEEAMAEELLAAANDAAADDGPAVPDAEADGEPLSGDPTRVKEIIERVSRLADEMADAINNGGGEAETAEASGEASGGAASAEPDAAESGTDDDNTGAANAGETDLGDIESDESADADPNTFELSESKSASAAS